MSNGTHELVNYEPSQIAPHDRFAEEQVLGSVLINPNAYHDVNLIPSDFFILRNAWVWEAMQRIAARGEVVEYVTVIAELRVQKRLEDIDGASYITFLASHVGTSVYIETYAQIVERCAIRRKLLEAAGEIAKLAREEEMDIDQVIDRSQQKLEGACERRSTNVRTMASGLDDLVAKHVDIANEVRESDAVKTGTLLDQLLAGGGLRPGGWVITADTSGGKSELTRNILENVALQNHHVHFASLEMSEEDVLTNMLSRFSGIPSDYLDEKGKPKDRVGADRYDAAVVKIKSIEDFIHFDDTETVSVYQVRSAIRRSFRDYGIRAAFVDYLELINIAGAGGDKDYMMVGEAFRQLRQLGRELGIPIIIPVQQNRSGMEGKKGIARSYDIAKHADGLIYIKDADGNDSDTDEVVEKWLVVDKQRRGKKGKRKMTFDFSKHAVLSPDDPSLVAGVVSVEDLIKKGESKQ